MAGKIHKDYERYTYVDGRGGMVIAPGTRRQLDYAEGYVARRKGGLRTANPHPVSTDENTDYWAWDQGWRDGDALYPSTHVGGPTPT